MSGDRTGKETAMNNQTRKLVSGMSTILAIILVVLGIGIEYYLVSLLGLLLILVMLVIRYIHIRKLNRQIREMKEGMNNEIEDYQDQ
jgi:Flp pilus assembly protein TadB